MKIRPLTIEGAYEVTPVQHSDSRGTFLEWYRFDALAAAVGHPLELAQANLSVSARDVVRGIHFADVPPGQAKYVTCVAGAVLDVVVDIRVGLADVRPVGVGTRSTTRSGARSTSRRASGTGSAR